ncbi:alpha/beta hydrolase [Terriglobus albidus]|uniref:Alpha/beta hydrolase n=1 Tax=Terriglobus albidus TaxID=1592106 RepID=A0A5B9E5Q1_9BACT|nr:alpha/beta hydrolase [Terriglobus albidus]QEE27572.1 alpha/beta hydrolase [Terriglobus albidus]
MTVQDDTLEVFQAHGAPALPPGESGLVAHEGARIWYCRLGSGSPVILLHGGLGHSGNWGYQVPFLLEHGFQVVLIDSRGQGRSTRDQRPYSYDLMASDVVAVMDALQIEKAALVGWSDGACTAMLLAAANPARVSGVFFFACNMDPSGVKPFEATPVLDRCFSRHTKDYAELSPTPDRFQQLVADLSLMQRTQPNYTAEDLAKIHVPVTIVQSRSDEFIRTEHAEYLARSIPNARLALLEGVTHFAPLQRPEPFNVEVLGFLRGLPG